MPRLPGSTNSARTDQIFDSWQPAVGKSVIYALVFCTTLRRDLRR